MSEKKMKNRKVQGSYPLPPKEFSNCSCWNIFNVENGVDVTYAVVADIVHPFPVVVGVTIVVVVVAVLFVAVVVVGTTLVVVYCHQCSCGRLSRSSSS
jgi:hypothetical protein